MPPPTPFDRIPDELLLRMFSKYFRPTEAITIFLALRLTSPRLYTLLNDNTVWNRYLMKGARTKVPGQAIKIFFEQPECRLPYYRLQGRAGQNYLSERVGDMLAITPNLESQSVGMTVIRPEANLNSEVADYFRLFATDLFAPNTVNYRSPEWQRLVVSDLAPLVDLGQLTGEQLFKWDSSPLQHLVATRQLTRREAHNLPIHMYYVLRVLADLRLVENNEITWAQIQELTVKKIKLLLHPQVRNVLRTYGILQIENLLRLEDGIAFFHLGTPNFCTVNKFLNLTPDQLTRVKKALSSIRSGKLSLKQCLSLTDEQHALLLSDYFTPDLLGTPNFCTIDEFLNLTTAQVRRVASTLSFISSGKLSLKECLSLTDEQYALFSNKDVHHLADKLTKEQVLALTPETLERIADPIVSNLIFYGMPLDKALLIPKSEHEGYRAMMIVARIIDDVPRYFPRREAFSLTSEETKNLAWTMMLLIERDDKFQQRGMPQYVTITTHQPEVLRIAKALTAAQRKWLKAEAFNDSNNKVPLEELFLRLPRLDLPEAPSPAQPVSVPN